MTEQSPNLKTYPSQVLILTEEVLQLLDSLLHNSKLSEERIRTAKDMIHENAYPLPLGWERTVSMLRQMEKDRCLKNTGYWEKK